KNWLFAGSDQGGERIANILTIIETAKLHGLNPEVYLTDVLTRVQDHPADCQSATNWGPVSKHN
ncbi:MAG: transposase domain-containing protein, partial [Hyphomicrobiales bacterium]|nr:transposase domain-containing protein [Hyphomicrobiales bacterium]MDE2114201.1 transposase domain-containing protein [Hyphomicrobiales bacterium]